VIVWKGSRRPGVNVGIVAFRLGTIDRRKDFSMPRGQHRLSALFVAAVALPVFALPARADPTWDWSSAAADHVAGSAAHEFLAAREALPSSQADHRDFAVKPRQASSPVAAPRTAERKPPRKNASHRLHKAPPTKSPGTRHAAKIAPAHTPGPAGRGVAAVTPPVQPPAAALHAKPRALAARRRTGTGPREFFIDRVAASDADEVMPAHPLTSFTRVPLAPPSAAQYSQRADSEAVSLRGTPLEPLDLN
jgi:hypothetical protein